MLLEHAFGTVMILTYKQAVKFKIDITVKAKA